jgi:hypothetical protein
MGQKTRQWFLWVLIGIVVLPILALPAAEPCHAGAGLGHDVGCDSICACACHLPYLCTQGGYVLLPQNETFLTMVDCQFPRQVFDHRIFRPPQA